MTRHGFLYLTLLSITLIYALTGRAEILTSKLNELSTVEREGLLVNQLNQATGKRINQLRCWQQGRLIVDEINLTPITGKNSNFSNATGRRLNTYDFGETFCLYTGD